MKLAVVSDTHFGAPDCLLVENCNGWRLKAQIGQQLDWLKRVDVLVLLGDIFELSIAAYEDAFAAARPFFDWLAQDTDIKTVVYCPGNHDAMMWHVIEYETRVARSLGDITQRLAKPLRAALPCLIDTTKASDWVALAGVSSPGNLFLSQFVGLPTFVAYPNVYVRTHDETVLLTHGHYFETYWAIFAEIVQRIASDDNVTHPHLQIPPISAEPTTKQVVDFNHPLVSLACMGIGQAGDLTLRARQIEQDAKQTPLTETMLLDKYLRRLREWLGSIYEPDTRPARWYSLDQQVSYRLQKLRSAAVSTVLDYGFERIRAKLNAMQPARIVAASPGLRNWLTHPDVLPRFDRYLHAARAEAAGFGLPAPTACVIGHTHRHELWPTTVTLPGHGTIKTANTGGWLTAEEAHVLQFDGSFELRPAFDQRS